MKEKLILILLSLFFYGKISAQSKADYNLYLKKAGQFSGNNPDSLLFYGKKLQTSDNQYLYLFGDILKAKYYYFNSQYDSCENILNSILQDIKTNRLEQSFYHVPNMQFHTYAESMVHIKINVYRRLFYVKKNQGLLDEAYSFLLLRKKALNELSKKNAYYLKNIIQIERGMALLKGKLGGYQESLDILLSLYQRLLLSQNQNIFDSTKFLKEKSIVEREIANSYFRLRFINPLTIDSGDIYIDKSFETIKRYDTNKSNLIDHYRAYYLHKAFVAHLKKEGKSGLIFLGKASNYLKSKEDEKDFYFLKAMCFNHLHQEDSTIFYGKAYLEAYKNKRSFKDQKFRIYDALAKTYFSMSIHDSAYKYSELALKGVQVHRKNTRITNHMLHENTKLEYESLNKEILEKKNKTKTQLIIVSLILIVSTSVFVFIVRKRKRQNRVSYDKLYRKYQELKVTTENVPPEVRTQVPSSPASPQKKVELKDQHTTSILEGLQKIENSRLFLSKDFSLPTLAKLLDSNTSYVSKTINDHLGKTFKEYLLELRMNALLNDLDENPTIRKYTIDALADYTGYTNPSSFSRAFKKHTQIAPSKYMKDKYG